MKKLALAVWAASGLSVFSLAKADTLTWKGSATGLFSASANWTSDGSHTSPQSGDTVKFPSTVTLEAESVDIGAAGLILENGADIGTYCCFTGSGKIVKRGAGRWTSFADSSFTGGLRAENGILALGSPKATQAFGTGEIELVKFSENRPFFDFGNEWGTAIRANFKVTGAILGSQGSLYAHNAATLDGSVVADSDVHIRQQYAGLTVTGSIAAPGHTLELEHNARWGTRGPLTCQGLIDAHVVVKAFPFNGNEQGYVVMEKGTENPDNDLTIQSGTNTLSETAVWAGTNVQVKVGARLALTASGNLATNAVLDVASGGWIEIANGAVVRIRKLLVGGVEKPEGCYGADELPEVIQGQGRLLVTADEPFVWQGGDGGAWNAVENWKDGRVPSPGSRVVFDGTATIGSESDVQTVDIGEAGLTICVLQPKKRVFLWTRFSGAGRLVFDGPGYCELMAACTHTGGTELRAGTVTCRAGEANSLGTGPIDIYRATDVTACLRPGFWNSSFTNEIRVHGHILGRMMMSGKPLGGAIAATNAARLDGALSSDTDLLVSTCYGSLFLGGAVTVPDGCGVTLLNGNDARTPAAWRAMRLEGPVAGNLTFEGTNEVCLAGTGTVARCTFTALGQTNVVAASGVWTGTNVVVRGESATLFLQGSDNLKPYAEVSVEEGGRIDLAQGVRIRVAALRVGGESLPIGIYTAKSLPNVLSGRGRLRVGDPGVVIIFR